MHGVRLVRTPVKNRIGMAVAGLCDSRIPIWERSTIPSYSFPTVVLLGLRLRDRRGKIVVGVLIQCPELHVAAHDLAILADDEYGAACVRTTGHQRAVCARDLAAVVGNEREREVRVVRPAHVRLKAVERDGE